MGVTSVAPDIEDPSSSSVDFNPTADDFHESTDNQLLTTLSTPHLSTRQSTPQHDASTTIHQTTATTATIHQTTAATTTTTTTTTAFFLTNLPVNSTDGSLPDDDVTIEELQSKDTTAGKGMWKVTVEDGVEDENEDDEKEEVEEEGGDESHPNTTQTHSTVELGPSKFLVSLAGGPQLDLQSKSSLVSMETTATNDVILSSTPPTNSTTAASPVDDNNIYNNNSNNNNNNPTLEDVTTISSETALAKMEVDPLLQSSAATAVNTTATTTTDTTGTNTGNTTSVQTTVIKQDVGMTPTLVVVTSDVEESATLHEEFTKLATTAGAQTSLTTAAATMRPTTSIEMLTNRSEGAMVPGTAIPTGQGPLETEVSPVTYSPYKPTCDTTDAAVSMWLGFPVFWWVVVAVAFVLILMAILSCCICMITSKRRWRKKNQQRRGYLDDQLTSSFIQSYSNPEVTPSSRSNKNGKIPPRPMKKTHKGRSSYPKSYHLGPQLLPFPADAVRLKPSSVPSSPLKSEDSKDLANGGASLEMHDAEGMKVKAQTGRDPETTFGTWRKSGVAAFGGFIPGYKKSSASNLVEADSSADKKPGKTTNDDEVFEEATWEAPRDVGLTTFCYKNNTCGGTTSTFKS